MARSYLYINSFLLCLVHVTYFPYHLKTWILTSFDCNLSIVLWSVSPCLPFLQGIQVVVVLLSQIIRSQWAGIINLVSLKFTVIKLCSFLALRLYTRNKMKRGLAFDTMRRHGECLINLQISNVSFCQQFLHFKFLWNFDFDKIIFSPLLFVSSVYL